MELQYAVEVFFATPAGFTLFFSTSDQVKIKPIAMDKDASKTATVGERKRCC
jgi:hypothetical protein